jgi:hypothetical protein
MLILSMAISAVSLPTKYRTLSRAGLYQVLLGQNHGDNELEGEDVMEPGVGNILLVQERHGWGTFKGKRKKQNKRRKQRKKKQKKNQQKRRKKKKRKQNQKQKNGRKKPKTKASSQPKIDRSCNCGISKDLIQVCISASFTVSLYLIFPCRE